MQKIEAIFHDAEREIPALGLVVAQGDTFEVSDEIAESLLEQESNFRVPQPKPAPPARLPVTPAPAPTPDPDKAESSSAGSEQ